MKRTATACAVMLICFWPGVTTAQPPNGPPAPPEPPDFPEPAKLLPPTDTGVIQTSFASERAAIGTLDPTAPPESGPTSVNVDIDLNGEFCTPKGHFTSFRYIPSGGSDGFGITSLEYGYDPSVTWWESWCPEGSTRFRSHLGFGIHWWSGPQTPSDVTILSMRYDDLTGGEPNGTEPKDDAELVYMPAVYGYYGGTHLPPRVYDLYLDLLWQEHWSDRFMTDILVSPGLFTDFRTTPPQSFRLRGHAIGLYSLSPDKQLVGGVDFINRLHIKALPVAGLLWRPNDDVRLHLVFPEPKISKRVLCRGNTEYWLFVAGEYGGGVWTYKTEWGFDSYGGSSHDRVEYSDLRLIAGVELFDRGEMYPSAVFEIGYVFDRHIRWQRAGVECEPGDTFMVGVRITH